jgi:intergrase/recombinase
MKQEKVLIAYAKKWMMSDESLVTKIEGQCVTFVNSYDEEHIMTLTYIDMFDTNWVWKFNEDTNKWVMMNED